MQTAIVDTDLELKPYNEIVDDVIRTHPVCGCSQQSLVDDTTTSLTFAVRIGQRLTASSCILSIRCYALPFTIIQKPSKLRHSLRCLSPVVLIRGYLYRDYLRCRRERKAKPCCDRSQDFAPSAPAYTSLCQAVTRRGGYRSTTPPNPLCRV